jgi:hypothetical protein
MCTQHLDGYENLVVNISTRFFLAVTEEYQRFIAEEEYGS